MVPSFMDDIVFMQPDRVVPPLNWLEHVPFAFALIKHHKPRVLVELGTHAGVSYCAFCQAVSAAGVPCRAFAVDTWGGDRQSGRYGDSVFQDLSQFVRQRYSSFSTLLRITFDEGLAHFPDGSVDLLHIDGCHQYEGVRHDFHSWLPKLSDRGIVLFHDTCVKEGNFGVWELFDELRALYPSFEFTHGYGLGVLAVGDNSTQGTMGALFSLQGEALTATKLLFQALGERLSLQVAVKEKDAQILELRGPFLHRLISGLRWIARGIAKLRQ